MNNIPFNKPYLTGKETHYLYDAVNNGQLSGNGKYTKLCHKFFMEKLNSKSVLLTSSCTDALEMCSILTDIKEGDEVILPSYTFVSTANAFVLRGAKLIFADCHSSHPNIDENKIEGLITPKTKAIVVVHYGGVACEMDTIVAIAKKHNLFVIEDAAQAIDSYYKGKPLGSIGHLATFSFHETKNIISGEGGLLAINDERFVERAEIIWEKGTNRSAFWRGEVDKYGWVDVGSSFLPSELTAAFLYAQLENLDKIQTRRKEIWNTYKKELEEVVSKGLEIPFLPEYGTANGHLFYLKCKNIEQRSSLISSLKQAGVYAVFHYLSLHKSPYYKEKHDGRSLPNTDDYADTLVRLPLFFELTPKQQKFVIDTIKDVI